MSGFQLNWGDSLKSTSNHPLSGITLWGLLRFTVRHWRYLSFLSFVKRWTFLLCMSALNSVFAVVEWLWYGRAIAAVELRDDPVFIVGQPRSGTTHLFNLLSLDEDHFVYSSTFDAGFASAFLWTRAWLPRLLIGILSSTRPMDNMKLSWDLPQEEELGTNTLSGGASPYASLCVLKKELYTSSRMTNLWTLEKETSEMREWQDAFTHMCKKLQYKGGPNRRLLIKSPVHTGRVAFLKRMFPKAQFIYIHRNPYRVFQSNLNMVHKYFGYATLCNHVTDQDGFDYVAYQYELMHNRYMDARSKLSRDQLYEIRFSDLDDNCLPSMTQIYKSLGWSDIPLDRMDQYLKSLGTFKKNILPEAPPATKTLMATRLRSAFDDFGYDL